MNNSHKKTPNLIVFLILTVLVVVSWVFLEIYRSYTAEPSPSVEANVLNDINPKLDTQVIEEIENRIYP